MIRVLQIVDHMSSGGIQAFIMNVYRHIDKEKIQFDFLLHHKYDHAYYQEIANMGGIIHYVEPRSKGISQNRRMLKEFFAKHTEYQIVHMHESSLSYLAPLEEAWKSYVNVKIFHSHSSSISGSKLHRLLHWWHKREIAKVADYYLACGELAAKWMYGGSKVENQARIVYNGIDLGAYKYNVEVREEVRKEFELDGKLVIGHTGRYDKVKNHRFLIDIAKELASKGIDFRIMLIGDGTLLEETKTYAIEKGVSEYILFLGVRSDVSRLLQGMDVFVLPSFYEGFPVVAIEAMAAGLPVVMSDTISKEVALKDNVTLKSLNEGAKSWADYICSMKLQRDLNNTVLYERGFDISATVDTLTKIYTAKDK